MPMISGAQPAEAPSMMRARGVRPSRWIAASEATMMAEAPSLRDGGVAGRDHRAARHHGAQPGQDVHGGAGAGALVGVHHRLALAGLDGHRDDLVLEAAGRRWPRGPVRGSGRRRRRRPRGRCRPRGATSSAVSGMEYVILPSRDSSPLANWGFANRQPMEVSKMSPGLAKAVLAASPGPRARGSSIRRRRRPRCPRRRT